MKTMHTVLLAGLVMTFAWAAEGPLPTSMSERERLDSLIKQNQVLTEELARLHTQCERPKTKEEAFAACMQAAKNTNSPMAAESVGEHCDQLLKR